MEINEPSGTEPEDLLEQLVRLEWLLKRQHLRRHLAHGPMASPQRGQGRILSLLKLKPEITQKELSDILDIRPQSLGELLAKLEKAGYIERTPSEEDRRGMVVRLTEAGRAAAEQPDPGPSALFDALSEEERINLASYLSRLIEKLEEDDVEFPEMMHGRHHGFGHHGPHDHGRGGPDFGGRGRHSFFGHDLRDAFF
jgi:DNA-binding MarR family transcriptional regulator